MGRTAVAAATSCPRPVGTTVGLRDTCALHHWATSSLLRQLCSSRLRLVPSRPAKFELQDFLAASEVSSYVPLPISRSPQVRHHAILLLHADLAILVVGSLQWILKVFVPIWHCLPSPS